MTEDQHSRIYWDGLMAVDEQTQENLDVLCHALNQMSDVNWAPKESVPLLAACIEAGWVDGIQACLDKGASIECALSDTGSSSKWIDRGIMTPKAIGVLLQHGWAPDDADVVTWAFVHPLRDLLNLTPYGLDLTVKDDQGWHVVDYMVQHDMAVGGHSRHLTSSQEDKMNFYLYLHQKGEDMGAFIPQYQRPERQAWVTALKDAQRLIEHDVLTQAIDTTQVSISKPKIM